MHRSPYALLLLLALALAPHGHAQQALEDAQGDIEEATGTDTSTIDKVVDGLVGTAEGIGEGVGAAGDKIGDGFSAVSGAVGKFFRAVAAGSLAAFDAVGAAGAAAVIGLSAGAIATGQGLAGGLDWTGTSVTAAGLLAGTGAWKAVAWTGAALGSAVAAAAGLYWDLMQPLRPAIVPPTVFAGAAGAGAVATTGVGGWAGWSLLRKWGLLGPVGVAGFSRIDDHSLLEHPIRSQLFESIQSSPGIHASQLARDAGIGWGTVTHHLQKMEKARIVAARKVNNQKCYFQNGGTVGSSDMQMASAVKNDTAGAIADYVTHNPMTSQKQMADQLGISPALASFHVKKLANLGVLEKVRHGKETLLSTTDAMRRLMTSEHGPVAAASVRDATAHFSS